MKSSLPPDFLPGYASEARPDRRHDRLLRLAEVVERVGLSIPTIYRRQRQGTFPRRERLGPCSVAWYESDIDEFVAAPMLYRSQSARKDEGSGSPSEIKSAQT